MNSHTPGLWDISGQSIISGDVCICVMEDDGGYEAPADQLAANTRLIAASPQLLEALTEVLRWAELPDSEQPKIGLHRLIADKGSIVRAAIAAVRGEK